MLNMSNWLASSMFIISEKAENTFKSGLHAIINQNFVV